MNQQDKLNQKSEKTDTKYLKRSISIGKCAGIRHTPLWTKKSGNEKSSSKQYGRPASGIPITQSRYGKNQAQTPPENPAEPGDPLCNRMGGDRLHHGRFE